MKALANTLYRSQTSKLIIQNYDFFYLKFYDKNYLKNDPQKSLIYQRFYTC